MERDSQGRRVEATAEAAEALRRLAAEHGPVILHITSGAEDGGAPMCFAEGELLLGPRDVLLGVVEGVPVYQMPHRPAGLEPDRTYRLDLVDALQVGFSLRPGKGKAFSLREVVTPAGGKSGA